MTTDLSLAPLSGEHGHRAGGDDHRPLCRCGVPRRGATAHQSHVVTHHAMHHAMHHAPRTRCVRWPRHTTPVRCYAGKHVMTTDLSLAPLSGEHGHRAGGDDHRPLCRCGVPRRGATAHQSHVVTHHAMRHAMHHAPRTRCVRWPRHTTPVRCSTVCAPTTSALSSWSRWRLSWRTPNPSP